MSDIAVIDAHLHIWDPARLPYAWLDGHPVLGRSFLLADYDAATAPETVSKMVFVECDIDQGHAVDEVAWVEEVAASDPRIAAIVGHAPVDTGDAVLATLEALEPFGLMRGVRRLIQSETEPGFCTQPGFIEGVRCLERFDWSFDICILGPQMDDAIGLVDACPNISFVLDHIGKPRIANAALEPWRTQMRRLAERSNVVCKLSGVATEADHAAWTPDQLRPFMDAALEAFGPSRLMFGGDWPVAIQAIDARRWMDVARAAVAELSETEQRNVFAGTAERFYRI